MSETRDRGTATPPSPQAPETTPTETLTDLIDRMDRESFRRKLDLRELKRHGEQRTPLLT